MELQRIWRSIRRRGMMVVQLLLVILTLGGLGNATWPWPVMSVEGKKSARANNFPAGRAGQGRAGPGRKEGV